MFGKPFLSQCRIAAIAQYTAAMSFHRGWDLLDSSLGPLGGYYRSRWSGQKKNFYFVREGVEFWGEFHEWIVEVLNAQNNWRATVVGSEWVVRKVLVNPPGGDAMEW